MRPVSTGVIDSSLSESAAAVDVAGGGRIK